MLDGDDRRQTFSDIISGQRFILFQQIVVFCIVVDHTGQCQTESVLMRTAFLRVDVVTEGIDIGHVPVVVLHGDLRQDPLLQPFHIYDVLMQRRLVLVEITDILDDAALIQIGIGNDLFPAFISQIETDVAVEKCQLTDTGIEHIIIIGGRFGKDRRIRLEPHDRSMAVAVSDHL